MQSQIRVYLYYYRNRSVSYGIVVLCFRRAGGTIELYQCSLQYYTHAKLYWFFFFLVVDDNDDDDRTLHSSIISDCPVKLSLHLAFFSIELEKIGLNLPYNDSEECIHMSNGLSAICSRTTFHVAKYSILIF